MKKIEDISTHTDVMSCEGGYQSSTPFSRKVYGFIYKCNEQDIRELYVFQTREGYAEGLVEHVHTNHPEVLDDVYEMLLDDQHVTFHNILIADRLEDVLDGGHYTDRYKFGDLWEKE